MKTTNEPVRRLKGYHKTFRGRFLLLKNRVLADEEFILWDLGFSVLADWDKENHPENYGSFSCTQEEIGSFLGWNKSKVSRMAKKLIKKGFWIKRTDGRFEVNGYEIQGNLAKITKEKGVVDLQEYFLEMQFGDAKTQQYNTNLQPELSKENGIPQNQEVAEIQPSIPKEPLVSSKSKSSVLWSDKEYQRIWEGGGYTMITVDDMKWIDKNI